jgi:signal transduction histidine kinase
VDGIGVVVALTALAQLAAGWPFAVSLATVAAAGGLRAGRRRSALNEALHELRRPLQALALATPAPRSTEPAGVEWSLQLAAAALERLDRAINGEEVAAAREPVAAGPLLAAAVGRWRRRAVLAGGSLELRWEAGGAAVDGDRCELSQALDNLIVNAIEHGGSAVLVVGRLEEGVLRLSVVDRGRAAASGEGRAGRTGLTSWLSGRRRHGHGLRVVRRTAVAHGGEFRLHRTEATTEAVLDLPVAGRGEVPR